MDLQSEIIVIIVTNGKYVKYLFYLSIYMGMICTILSIIIL